MNILEVNDRFGKLIALSDERWDHITARHPEMIDHLEGIKTTLQDPSVIIENMHDPNIKLYHKFFTNLSSYIVVVINETKRFIITAYLSYGIKRGRITWQKT